MYIYIYIYIYTYVYMYTYTVVVVTCLCQGHLCPEPPSGFCEESLGFWLASS